MLLTLASCTHNNGDIGPLFGQWKVTSIDIDEKPMEDYKGNLFFSFQNDVVLVYGTYGQWIQTGNSIDFIFSMEPIGYPNIPGFKFGHNPYQIISLNKDYFNFTSTIEGKTYTYHLKKWN